MKQRYFMELEYEEINLMRNMCDTYYKIAKENGALRKMLEAQRMNKKLNSLLEKRIKE